jgi:[acyl-carrier-protein] S-malonyltransferase
MKRAFVFPGQGSQIVGMGKKIFETYPEARDIFLEIDESLGQNLSQIMFEGPEDSLNMTENTQPALMAVSMAIMAILKNSGMDTQTHASFVAGHSLGEYSALTAAGSFMLSDTARLLKLRGQSMQKAVPVGVGSMAAILGLSLEEVQAIANEASNSEICAAANDNSVGQVVVSGHAGAVAAAVALATQKGAKRAVTLPVSAPFHCALMKPAADVMADALSKTDIKAPAVPVVSNITAQGESDPARIRNLLVDQITGMVRWRESVLWMKAQGVTEIIEIGSGKVLCGLIKRIDKDINCIALNEPEQIDEFLKTL